MISALLLQSQCPYFLHRRLCHLLILLPRALRGEASCHPADEHLPAMLACGQRWPHAHPATSLLGLPEGCPEQGTALLRGRIFLVPLGTPIMQRGEGFKDSSPSHTVPFKRCQKGCAVMSHREGILFKGKIMMRRKKEVLQLKCCQASSDLQP